MTGGGQPIVTAWDRLGVDPRVERAKALYMADKQTALRKSHDNPEVRRAYDDFLGEVGGHKAHELLHTHYTAKPKYKQ